METFYRQKATKTASYIRKEAVYINILIISGNDNNKIIPTSSTEAKAVFTQLYRPSNIRLNLRRQLDCGYKFGAQSHLY